MAPTTVVNSTGPLPTGQGFGGDEFSNNLFSDLAPLLTLFGEQVTKQFLSMSMGWADDILLAMGPLGIITVIVSAIRVGGIKILKALVGRARESRASAEKEILSSTSEDVCELWSGREIVRELGTPGGMKDLILLAKPRPFVADHHLGSSMLAPRAFGSMPESIRVFDINTAVNYGILKAPPELPPNLIPRISDGAPNIALNVRNSTASPIELWAWAIFGTMLQISALVFPAVSTYHLKWGEGGTMIAAYGYPCFAAGTIMVVFGMIFCGRVIEGSTTEDVFTLDSGIAKKSISGKEDHTRKQPVAAQIMRLQKACTVSDQHFQPYAIFNSTNDACVRTSRLNSVPYSLMSAVATLTAIVGFVMQFVGLRALHWSATIHQLGVMLILTIVRSSVRRGLFGDPDHAPLLDGHELAWLTLYIMGKDRQGWATEKPELNHKKQMVRENADDEGRMQNLQTSVLPPPEIPKSNQKTSKSWNLSVTGEFPFIVWSIPSVLKETPELEQLMLKGLVRWEPVTGNYNIKEIQHIIGSKIRRLNTIGRLETLIRRLQDERIRLNHAFYPLSGRTTNEKTNGTDGVTDTLGICRDLQPFMPTSDEARDAATILARAIERIMLDLAQTEDILWRQTQNPFRHPTGHANNKAINFHTALVGGSYDDESAVDLNVLTLCVTAHYQQTLHEDDEVWTIDRETISSVICLWLFSLELRKNAARELAPATRWLGMLEERLVPLITRLYTRRNTYFRIVSSAVNSGNLKHDQLCQWLRDPIENLPKLGEGLADNMDDLRGTEPKDNVWVVWGARYSTLFESGGGHTSREFAVRTRPDTTLAGHCALELFSCFMEAIADRIEAIGGTTRHFSERPDKIDSLENSLLQSIASQCVSAGLARDEEEAYSVIIPPFMKNKLLPEQAHPEIKYPRRADDTASTNDESGTDAQSRPVTEHIQSR